MNVAQRQAWQRDDDDDDDDDDDAVITNVHVIVSITISSKKK